MAITKLDPANYDWLKPQDEGHMVMVKGHYQGDFVGVVKYGGRCMAIVTDASGKDIEVCYMHPVEFTRL